MEGARGPSRSCHFSNRKNGKQMNSQVTGGGARRRHGVAGHALKENLFKKFNFNWIKFSVEKLNKWERKFYSEFSENFLSPTICYTKEPPGHKPLVVDGVVMGPFEEEEEGTCIASDVVKVEGAESGHPRSPDSRNDTGTAISPILGQQNKATHT